MTLEEYNKAVDIYADNLYRFILKNCRNETLAQDVVQDSFEKLWMKIEGVEGAKVKSYLFTTAYHTMLDLLKKEKRMGELDKSSELTHHHSEQFSDLGEVLQDALSRIPEIQRTVILLRDYEGYTYEEIGKITELTESQVKVYIYRGRISLKGYLMKIENII
ncbi:MAG: RNA polymerase sigma factor [Bacteroidales bacterium]|jgi:RNA polymerase sigma factor (sigma-70 family)|nr:RNA polymerase sigma factor [Bacteroidales bacterium]